MIKNIHNHRFLKKSIAMLLSLSINGCELIGPDLQQKLPIIPVNKVEDENSLIPQLANQSGLEIDANKTKVEIFPADQPVSG